MNLRLSLTNRTITVTGCPDPARARAAADALARRWGHPHAGTPIAGADTDSSYPIRGPEHHSPARNPTPKGNTPMPHLTHHEAEALTRRTRAAGFTEDSPVWWTARDTLHDHLTDRPEDVEGAYRAAQKAAEARQADLDLFNPDVFIEPGYVAVTWAAFGGFELVESYGDSLGTGLRVCIERKDFERYSMLPADELDDMITALTKLRRARDLVASQGFEFKHLRRSE